MKIDLDRIVYKDSLMKSTGLNSVEFRRVVNEIFRIGIRDNEDYDTKIDKVVKEERARYNVHVQYIWSKSRDNRDILYLKYIRKIGGY